MEIYNKLREVPQEMLKPILGGRLKGMSDIKPQWRIQKLTEVFGMCGFGWKYEVTNKWIEQGAKNEAVAFVDINLFVKVEDKWSEPIYGNGGSMFIASEKNGMFTSDEAYKMAITDALGTAAKHIGLAADIYMGMGGKYEGAEKQEPKQTEPVKKKQFTEKMKTQVNKSIIDDKQSQAKTQIEYLKDNTDISEQDLNTIILSYELKFNEKWN